MKFKIICGVLVLVVCVGIFAGCKREKAKEETTSSTKSITTTQSTTETTTESTTAETEIETKTTIKKVAKTTEKAYKNNTTTTLITQPETTQETTVEVTEETTTQPLDDGRIILEQFNQVQLGMSYEQVCEIFGKTADSKVQRSKYSPKVCMWINYMEQLGVDSQGAPLYPHVFTVFSSNELTEIRQKGLR